MNQQNTRPEKQEKIATLLSQLETAGRRATPQRYAVCQALVEHGGHPTVAEVFERVRDIFPMMSQATVYNTIDALEEVGLLHRLDIANHDHTHYDLDLTPHINVVCRYCESITDVFIDTLDDLLTQVSERTGYKVDHHIGLVVYGVCPKCLAEGKDAPSIPEGEHRCQTEAHPPHLRKRHRRQAEERSGRRQRQQQQHHHHHHPGNRFCPRKATLREDKDE
ncbi:MAG: transcriptional repressor [Chloroflexaceae bacterium]|nr:transcriptional repressor [Chloroflexaceae bacterium]